MTQNVFDIVVVRSWEELLARPAHKTDIALGVVKLGKIVGKYSMPTMGACGLPSCHRSHKNGYVIRLTSDYETHIGKDCGKRHFEEDWQAARSDYTKRRAAFDREIVLSELITSLPELRDQLETIKQDGLSRVWQLKNQLQKHAPGALMSEIERRARRKESDIVRVIRRTKSEIELERARQNFADPTKAISVSAYNEVVIGRLQGLELFSASIRNLIQAINKVFDYLGSIESVKPKHIPEVVRLAGEIQPIFQALRDLAHAGRRFFDASNLGLLVKLPSAQSAGLMDISLSDSQKIVVRIRNRSTGKIEVRTS